MKQFLVILAILTGGLSQVYGQLPYPEMKLSASGGELHGYARAVAKTGNSYVGGSPTDVEFDDKTLLPMTDNDVNKAYYRIDKTANKTIPSGTPFYAEGSATVQAQLDASVIGTSFTYDPHIQISGVMDTFTKIANVISNLLNRAEANTWLGGKYSMTCIPNNWSSAQEVPAELHISGYAVDSGTPAGVSMYDEHSMFVKVTWGGSYVYAVYNQLYEIWEVEEVLRKQLPNGSYYYDYDEYSTDDYFLDIQRDTVENVGTNGSIVGEVIVSNVPTQYSWGLPAANNTHYIEQYIENFLGTGSGAGQYAVYWNGATKLTPGIKLKKQ